MRQAHGCSLLAIDGAAAVDPSNRHGPDRSPPCDSEEESLLNAEDHGASPLALVLGGGMFWAWLGSRSFPTS
jgi:hypothetical protein